MREELKEFAEFQEKVLVVNDFKRGWLDMSTSTILERIKQEVKELEIELINLEPTKARYECADIANYCMFLAYKLERTVSY